MTAKANINSNIQGFSLIELCIVMIIGGILLAGILNFYQGKLAQIKQDMITEHRQDIQKALVDFITDDPLVTTDVSDQRYPCPADPELKPGDANYGVESTATATGTCVATGGIIRVAGNGGDVFIGALPVVTLGLNENLSYDNRKHQYTYAVSDSVSRFRSMVNTNATGSIRLRSTIGWINQNAQFVVVSHGRDGEGAYSMEGVRIACSTTTRDAENCNDDATFVSFNINDSEGANHFDDYVFATLSDDINDGWMQATDTAQTHIITKNSGNLGIGVVGRAPAEKLEVVGGNIKTDTDVKADQDVEAGNAMKAKFFYYTD